MLQFIKSLKSMMDPVSFWFLVSISGICVFGALSIVVILLSQWKF